MEETVKTLLFKALKEKNITDATIEIENNSKQHAGHFEGNGSSHFTVFVNSTQIMQVPPLQRHRMLNSAIAHLVDSGEIHAISFQFNKK